MINWQWLQTFCTLVELQHFTKTAERLNMTQSGVSQQIQKLEQQLHTRLLNRQGKRFTLTPQGERLYQGGSELLKTWRNLSEQIQEDPPYEGKVAIMSPGSCGLTFYRHLLQLQQQHSKLVIDYQFAPNQSIENAVAHFTADLGFITRKATHPDLTTIELGQEPLLLVTPNTIEKPTWQQLQRLGAIGHPDFAHHANLLLSQNFAEFTHVEQLPLQGFSNQISLILEPVSIGLGFTVLPANAVAAFHQQTKIKIHQLTQPVNETIYACYHRYKPLANRVKTVLASIQQLIANSE